MKILKHQQWHLVSLAILLFGLFYFIEIDVSFLSGEILGLRTRFWFFLALLSPILHQVYVLITWRSELLHKGMTKRFGAKAFSIFKRGFALLILSRPITILLLAISNAWTLSLNPSLTYVLSALLFIPVAYLFYSLRTYFGIDRAFGIDHFQPEQFKNSELVKGGLFKYLPNAMYVAGFLLLYIPGILLQSKAALLIALFNHLYIWVHYYFTELPDMKEIYSKK